MFMFRHALIVFALVGLLVASGCCDAPVKQPTQPSTSQPATRTLQMPLLVPTYRPVSSDRSPVLLAVYSQLRKGSSIYLGTLDRLEEPTPRVRQDLHVTGYITVTQTLRGTEQKSLILECISYSSYKRDYGDQWPQEVTNPGAQACYIIPAKEIQSNPIIQISGASVLPATEYAGEPAWDWLKRICILDESFAKPEQADARLASLLKATGDSSPHVRSYADQALVNEFVSRHPQQVADALVEQFVQSSSDPAGAVEIFPMLGLIAEGMIPNITLESRRMWGIRILTRMSSIQPHNKFTPKAMDLLAMQVAGRFPTTRPSSATTPATTLPAAASTSATTRAAVESSSIATAPETPQTQPAAIDTSSFASTILTPDQIASLAASIEAAVPTKENERALRLLRHWLNVTSAPFPLSTAIRTPFRPKDSAALLHSMVKLGDFYDLQRSRCYVYVGKVENYQHEPAQGSGAIADGTASLKIIQTIQGPKQSLLLVEGVHAGAFDEKRLEVPWPADVLEGKREACFFIAPAGDLPNGSSDEKDRVVALIPAVDASEGHTWDWLHKIVQLEEDIGKPNATLHRLEDLIQATVDPSPQVRYYGDIALMHEYFSHNTPAAVDALVKQLTDPIRDQGDAGVGLVVLYAFGRDAITSQQTPPGRIQRLQVLCGVSAVQPVSDNTRQAVLSLAWALDAPFPPAPDRPSSPKTSPPTDLEAWSRNLPPILPPNPPLSEAYHASEVLNNDQIKALRASLVGMEDNPEIAQAKGIIHHWLNVTSGQ